MKAKLGILIIALALTMCFAAGTAAVFAAPDAAEMTIQQNEPIRISLAPQEGYVLPEQLILKIGETQYIIYTDGQNEPEGIAFDPAAGLLSIAAELIKDGDTLTLAGTAEEESAAPMESPEPTATPEAAVTPEPTAEPEATAVPEPTAEPEPTTEPAPTEAPDATSEPAPEESPTADPAPAEAGTEAEGSAA